ncbi:MAG: response regulator [Myxococcaceae bacterium]|nr:response regulator [Myxococcaceae bacterium]
MNSENTKILIVDDTPENLVALEALLKRDDVCILSARSGPEALELMLAHELALAFLDVHMPGMDGFELAELMRGAERTKHVPIIFVTAGSKDPQRVFKGYNTGAVDFLFKPIEPRVLQGKTDVFLELYRQKRELANALRLNEMFVGILGHDLRSPLGAMLTGAQLLVPQLKDEADVLIARKVINAGKRMTEMIDQMLDLTRARLAGGLGFVRARETVDLGALVKRSCEELRIAFPERQVAIEIHGDVNTSGDPHRLLQVFSNLLANALHHGAPESKVEVAIEGTALDIQIKVRNQGVIPPELLPVIFDPFRSRSTGAAKARGGGLGLGLFIAQQIALAHGGNVTVESAEPHGTCFTLRLPRVAVRSDNAAAPRHVLIVDDDTDTRDSLRAAFEAKGYRASTARDGAQALKRLTQGGSPPDVVILDLGLPVIDGGGVFRAMQADPVLAKIPVVVSTGQPELAPAGAIVVPKPLKLDRLLKKVAALVPFELPKPG